ncbi:YqcI/YcgG family protein [Muricauda sp. F6463D]|nr:guanitoxin biosynthesis heme-dependent pre-guanitoxin N-hydroxylase GntA [Muricauda sp. F6463D]MCK0159158.1 YqcI/YcgG family protein [Muricauda sp. F6463D]
MKRKEKKHTTVRSAFEDFVIHGEHPCLMAQNIFKKDEVTLNAYENFGTKRTAQFMFDDIMEFLEDYDFETNNFQTYIATFPLESIPTEKEFEQLLWQQLQSIHDIDTFDWDPSVSSNPESDKFSFSIGGKAFYIVGLHPESSRKARQAPFPTLVFNLHWQFEQLRRMGAYQRIRDAIRERDKKLQNSINPMLKDFGTESECKQYSGKKVGKEWKCPFSHSRKLKKEPHI